MKIAKILNNNAVMTYDKDQKEVILLGKGIAYGKKTGEVIDMKRVTKTFDIGIEESQKKLVKMLIDIPIEYLEISDLVFKKVQEELDTEINESLYLSITDHIYTSIERYREGLKLKNQMLLEIKHMYEKEFKLGLWTLKLIKSYYDIEMEEDEAAFIAMHIVSNKIGNSLDKVYEMASFVQTIVELVSEFFEQELDEESLAYYRFVTHLKHFSFRMFKDKSIPKSETLHNDLLEFMKEKYVMPYLCTLKIGVYLRKKYNYQLKDDEILYLTIHISKIICDKKGGKVA